ncbi:phosphatase PAP2 family protein [Gardnerella vaginalis]|uniref:phosphatase PAP2 family protein n=1 Tax=Gardnerella vaginalis TaxID=2702 RepID=UPI000C9AF45D|nr:phosphatase PAP2 family protein [Gardnerella vaginalis]MCT7730619.1 phosphatase PAP2 family protein [Lactobacillus iners]MDK7212509.1 phosphatase PAP2 family protein [Gardnerella vaginalis]MDK8337210.1 phosphatase PAP2 family protein [Gardnerella vaginalis]NSX29254.1 phosphatase PAP2 family protein [Gardnerella vaginalis]PMC50263.1 phosphoesterase [Gardnerella vaginalis]
MNQKNQFYDFWQKIVDNKKSSIVLLLAILIPCIGKGVLVMSEERSLETGIVAFFHNYSPSFIMSISKILAIIFSTKCCIVILFILCIISYFLKRNWRITLTQLVISLLPMVYIFAIKFIVHRPRPFIGVKVKLPPDPSFPSGHTAAAVAICAMSLMILYVSNKSLLKIGLIISIVVVVIVALSRLVVAAHFPTDVITSAIMYPILVMYNLDFFKNSSFINRKILKR